jgi:hypothetical protein
MVFWITSLCSLTWLPIFSHKSVCHASSPKHEQDYLSSACHRNISFTPLRNSESRTLRIHHYEHYSPTQGHVHPSHTTSTGSLLLLSTLSFPCTIFLSQVTPSLCTTRGLNEASTSGTNSNLQGAITQKGLHLHFGKTYYLLVWGRRWM